MYLLDTNVISELVRPRPSTRVVAWVSACDPFDLHISVLTLGEVARGIALLSAGRQRSSLRAWAQDALPRQFAGRIVGVDAAVAELWGNLDAEARRLGRPIGTVDGLLVATAASRGLSFATRNVEECRDRGVPIIDPWHGA